MTATLPPPATPAPPPKQPPKAAPPMMTARAPAAVTRPLKSFTVRPWAGEGEGQKGLIYSASGMGKTTLATMSPEPIFIGVDDGGRMIRHPQTGKPVNAIQGVHTFADIRDALHQSDLFPPRSTLVIDTITRVETLAEAHVIATVKTERNETAENLESYGYGKGLRHVMDAMRMLMSDMEPLIRNGVNVLLLAQVAQAKIANLEGVDYIQDGPKLQAQGTANVRTEYCEWVDWVFRIAHTDIAVATANVKATKGKVRGTTARAIFTEAQLHFVAKNRSNGRYPPCISFGSPDDDSVWDYVFRGADFRKQPVQE